MLLKKRKTVIQSTFKKMQLHLKKVMRHIMGNLESFSDGSDEE